MKVKEETEKFDLKLNIQKTKIMASSPITSWQIEGEKVEAVTDFIFLGSKITADGDCSQGFKRYDNTSYRAIALYSGAVFYDIRNHNMKIISSVTRIHRI